MSQTYLDKIYAVTDEAAQRDVYDDWAGSYDAELASKTYLTPGRVAAALKASLPEDEPPPRLLDFACGTGLSGAALAEAGFADMDGCDVSQGMLDIAAGKQIYRRLIPLPLGDPDPALIGGYEAIAAAGAISPGAAPASCLTAIADAMAKKTRLAFSYNEIALSGGVYKAALDAVLSRPDIRLDFSEDGPHLEGEAPQSRVMVLVKT